MCQANPPPGSNPSSRGSGNTIGGTNYDAASPTPPATHPQSTATPQSQYVPPTPQTTPGGSQVPYGANAVAAPTTQSFQEQGFAGVATRNPDGSPLNSAATVAPAVGGIVGPRMMDTGSLFGSPVTGANPSFGTGGVASPTPTPTASAPIQDYSGYSSHNPASVGGDVTTDPYILRDQMYGLNPTPVNSVTNALMRRYRGYYG